jgi:PhnB protein
MKVQSYLFFDGRCDEALEFYRKALGAEVINLMRFKDNPDTLKPSEGCPGMPPEMAEKVMHASFRVGETDLLASDGRCEGKPAFQGFGLAITVKGKDKAEKTFAALGEGGQVQMPLTQTFFSPAFGMVADKFGVPWMVVAEH